MARQPNLEFASLDQCRVLSERRAPFLFPDVATYTLTAAHSGLVIVMPDLTANSTITLPSVRLGLCYTFIYSGAAADAQNWIITSAAASELIVGGGILIDQDAGAGADECIAVFANGTSHRTLTVTTPQVGTRVELFCDGRRWIANAIVVSNSATGLAFST